METEDDELLVCVSKYRRVGHVRNNQFQGREKRDAVHTVLTFLVFKF